MLNVLGDIENTVCHMIRLQETFYASCRKFESSVLKVDI